MLLGLGLRHPNFKIEEYNQNVVPKKLQLKLNRLSQPYKVIRLGKPPTEKITKTQSIGSNINGMSYKKMATVAGKRQLSTAKKSTGRDALFPKPYFKGHPVQLHVLGRRPPWWRKR